jgi:hypothetical protein
MFFGDFFRRSPESAVSKLHPVNKKGIERQPNINEMMAFIKQTLQEKGSEFEAEFNRRLKELGQDLPATPKEQDYSSRAMHSVEQKYKLVQEMLAEEEGK